MRNKLRATVLISLLLIMNLFDLYLTVLFVQYFELEELNPVARLLIKNGTYYLIIFKAVVVFFSLSVLLYCYNKSKIALASSWFLIAVFSALMIYWIVFLKAFNDSMNF